MTANNFDLDQAMQRLEQFQDGDDEMAGQVAVDVRHAARSLGIERNPDAVSEATKMALRCANQICDFVLSQQQPDEQLLNTLRQFAGDAFNELREKEITSESRDEAESARDAQGRLLAARMKVSKYGSAMQQRHASAKWARGTAAYQAAEMRQQSRDAALDAEIRAEARRIAEKAGGDGRTMSARYKREYARLTGEAGGARLGAVALHGSTTPDRPLPDTRF